MEVARLRCRMAYESSRLRDKDECCVGICDDKLPLPGSTGSHFLADNFWQVVSVNWWKSI
jgi:hypothetical protein